MGRKKTLKSDNGFCLNPAHADKEAKTRGLCQSCYHAAGIMIRNKETTWADLIKAGKALDKNNSSMNWLRN